LALEQNNAAARLHFRLSTLRSMGDNTRLLDAWRGILVAPGNDNNFKFSRRYGQMLALPERARNALMTVPNLNQELFFRWMPKLDAALTGNSLNATVGSFFATFDKSALENLEYCADLLSRVSAGENYRH
jgi:hypothetical protein